MDPVNVSSEQIEQLLRLFRIARAQLILHWQARTGSEEERVENRVLNGLRAHLERETGRTPSRSPLGPDGPVFFPSAAGDDNAALEPGGLTIQRPFTGNVSRDALLFGSWVRKHWLPFFSNFENPVLPNFVALVTEVELSGKDILDAKQERALLTRYLRPIPGWTDLADAEFRVCRQEGPRFFLNFGLSTYRTMKVGLRGQRAAKPDDRGRDFLEVEMTQEMSDSGIKLRIDANTKVNILNGLGPIVVSPADLEKCVDMTVSAIVGELASFLRLVSEP